MLQLDLSSYWVKKVLLKTEYQSILDSCDKGRILYTARGEVGGKLDKDDLTLIMILAQPEFKAKVQFCSIIAIPYTDIQLKNSDISHTPGGSHHRFPRVFQVEIRSLEEGSM